MSTDSTTTAAETEKAKIIERIRRTLALAKDRAGTPEGETAARIAANMMASHAIEMADVDVAARAKTDPLTVGGTDLGLRAEWVRSLFFAVCRHCGCRGVVTIGTTRAKVYGYAHDVAVAEYLFEIIKEQVLRAASKNGKELPSWMGVGEKRKAFNDFCASAEVGVEHKLTEIKRSAVAEAASAETAKTRAAGGTALVLKTREEAAVAFYEANKGKTKTLNAKGPSNFDQKGYQTGRNVSLTPGIAAGKGGSTPRVRG